MKLKIWEVLKEMDENHNKTFRRYDDGLIIRIRPSGYIELSEEMNLNIIDDWVEREEAVGFLEAFASGKMVRVEHRHLREFPYEGHYSLGYVIDKVRTYVNKDEFADVILNGKWYIEGD